MLIITRTTLIAFLLCILALPKVEAEGGGSEKDELKVTAKTFANHADQVLANIKSKVALPDRTVFQLALQGYMNLKNTDKLKKELLTVIDFSLPSTEKRLWVIDLKNNTVLHHTLVAHGRGTGDLYAKKFSNIPESHQSSLGFYVTSETYHGKHGLSMRLDGMEKGINDNARDRAIVVHGAAYANPSFAKKYGRLGRSYGCPALPEAVSADIIKEVAGESCLFIYAADDSYATGSMLLQQDIAAGI